MKNLILLALILCGLAVIGVQSARADDDGGGSGEACCCEGGWWSDDGSCE